MPTPRTLTEQQIEAALRATLAEAAKIENREQIVPLTPLRAGGLELTDDVMAEAVLGAGEHLLGARLWHGYAVGVRPFSQADRGRVETFADLTALMSSRFNLVAHAAAQDVLRGACHDVLGGRRLDPDSKVPEVPSEGRRHKLFTRLEDLLGASVLAVTGFHLPPDVIIALTPDGTKTLEDLTSTLVEGVLVPTFGEQA